MNDTRVTITLPSLGEGVSEASITRWLVAPGDTVDQGDPMVEIATDKVDTEIPAPQAGTVVAIFVAEDETVEVDIPIAVISVASDEPSESPSQSTAQRPAAETSMWAPETRAPVPQTQAPASEPTAPEPEPPPPAPAPQSSAPIMNKAPSVPDAKSPAAESAQTTTVEKLPRIRQVIARRMLESIQNSAQLTTVVEVDVTRVGHLRLDVKDEFERVAGTKLSYLPFFVKATVEALVQHSVISATTNEDCTEITYHHNVDLGIAVDSPKGLMVPVIRDAQHLSVGDLAVAIADLGEQVRAGTISPDKLNGGTFTITNTGSRGALFDTPILNRPQSGILATGVVVERVVPQRGDHGTLGLGVRSIVYLAISYDHRIVDGADAARFLGTVKQRLEVGFERDEVWPSAMAEHP